jgi:hypothetical protein
MSVTRKVKQVAPHAFFPSGDGRAIAMLRFEPNELAQSHGLTFERGTDDFDAYQLAAVKLADGSQAWLMRYQGNPVPGTVVYAGSAVDPTEAQRLVGDALGLEISDLSWRVHG